MNDRTGAARPPYKETMILIERDTGTIWQEFGSIDEAITVLGYSDYRDFREDCVAKALYDEHGNECGVLVRDKWDEGA